MSNLLEIIGAICVLVGLWAINPMSLLVLFGVLMITIGYKRGDNK
jgi:4-hydroxybenzoate polyprenyltransferase